MSEINEVVWVHRLAASGSARAIRAGAGLTASDMARELGVSVSAVSRWERCERRPRPSAARDWAVVLCQLVGGGDPMAILGGESAEHLP